MKKAIIVSGYFNPLHKGHIDYFRSAKEKADFIIVILNNDRQRALKRSKEFMLEDERAIILRELRVIDEVFISVDTDKTVCKSIEKVHSIFSKKFKLFFGNGGDQNNKTSPEVPVCNRLGIELIDGLGSKIQSSSWLLKN